MAFLKRLPIRALVAALALQAACTSGTPGLRRGPAMQDDRQPLWGPPAVAGVDGPLAVLVADQPARPWIGAPPVVRTTADIMAEAARQPFVEARHDARPFVKIKPDRRVLPTNPASPRASQWPPSPRVARDLRAPRFALTPSTPNVDLASLGADTNSLPPDTQGDVGPTQYLLGINGRIRTINKSTGSADGVLDSTFNSFFSSVRNGVGTSDPRVRYDRRTDRWFVIMINVAVPNRNLLAVSDEGTISPSTAWSFYFWTNTRTAGGVGGADSCLGDYPTLGVDEDALYIGVNQFCGPILSTLSFDSTSAYVINKATLVAGTLSVAQFDGVVPSGGSVGPYTPQGVDNVATGTNQGYFIGVDNLSFGVLVLRRVSNPAGSPSLSGNINVTVPTTRFPIDVPHFGGVLPLDGLDDRLLQAVVRNGRLWTTHQMEVDTNGVATVGGGRNGIRWYKLQNLGATPSVAQAGTVFDSSGFNPRNYWMGAIMPNGQGHVALGMSTAGATFRVDAAVTGRVVTDALGAMDTPTLYSNSQFDYNVQSSPATNQRWGDYSNTSVDPDDDMTMWTLQEYVDGTDSYAVRLVRLQAPPPASIVSLSPSTLGQNVTGASMTVNGSASSGSGFFDPGPGFLGRLAVSFSGSGVSVTNVTVTSPTSITLTVNTSGAAAGPRTLTVTNPDGQTSQLTSALTITSGPNQPPTFGSVPANQQVFDSGSGVSTGPLAFMVSDPEGAPVTVTGTSSNTAVVPQAGVVIGGSGSSRTVTVSTAGASTIGVSTITLTASDGQAASQATFTVTVTTSSTPGSPQNLAATVVRSAVTFSWQAPATSGEPTTGYTLEAGYAPGTTAVSLPLGNVLTFSVAAPDAVYYVRLRARTAAGFGPPSNEVVVATGQAASPLAPLALLATVQGTTVQLQWTENPLGPAIAGYQLQAGHSAGVTDVAVLPFSATARGFSAVVPVDTYFVRIVAVNAAGTGAPSNEAILTPGPGVCTIPSAPTGVSAGTGPGAIGLTWNPPSTGAIPTTYRIQAGTASGLANWGAVDVPGTLTSVGGAVPPGPYFIRVFALNAWGHRRRRRRSSATVP